ncbi:uncharacterized protein LOC113215312 [Frankliniella occidentalis]|uniref:Uncharacterized protein LOC113215312 n=1 Tax=Frankliniella occidentalis TaxID=133901 RepID=A0A9C6X6P3_FRAOC|nr:uncharacterized protein LOC113215312 [Frankliniella occidentalis]
MMCSTQTLEEPEVVLHFDPIAVGWRGVSHQDKGILSMELTSVCNTLLQVLVHIPAVVHWLSTSNHPASCKVKNGCLLCACCSVLMQLDVESVVKPDEFLNIMKDACDDPQVVVEDILLRLHSDYMSLYSTVRVSIWSERTSPPFQIFGGLWKLSAPCCGVTYKPFFTLKVPLSAQTIQLCLNGLKACDVCEVCDCPDMSIPTDCSLHTAPAVLILNLKRFLDDNSFCAKNVIIQPEITLLKQYLYCLRSVVFVNGTSPDLANFYPVTVCPMGVYNEFTDAAFKKVSVTSLIAKERYLQTSYMAVYELTKVTEIYLSTGDILKHILFAD